MTRPTFTGLSADVRALIIISNALETVTYRFAIGGSDVHVHSGDLAGTYYGNVVTGASQIRHDIGDNVFPTVILPQFNFTIARSEANRDDVDALISFFKSYPQNIVNVYLVTKPFTDAADTDLEFSGKVLADGVTFTTSGIEITADSVLAQYDIDMPKQTYGERYMEGLTIYSVPDAWRGEPVPILYGDWSSQANDEYQISCGVMKSTTGVDIRCLVADPNDNGIESIGGRVRWRDGADNPRTEMAGFDVTNASLTTGIFTVDGSDTYNDGNTLQDGDVFLLKEASGNTNDVGSLIENPALILLDLMVTYGEVPETKIDTASFYAAAAATSTLKYRRHVRETGKLLSDFAMEICRDAGYVLTVVANKFVLSTSKFFVWGDTAETESALTFGPMRVADSQRVTLRPKNFDYNSVRVKYRYNPKTEKFTRTLKVGDSDPTLEVESKWIWKAADANTLAGWLYTALTSANLYRLDCNVPFSLDLGVNAIVTYTGDGTTTYFFILRAEKNLETASTSIVAVNTGAESYAGKWMAPGSPDYASSTEGERRTNGYWIDAPTSANAKYSRWTNE